MIIRQSIAADHPQLLDIWLRAVRATHHFLQASDIDALLPQLRDVYFQAVELWVPQGEVLAFGSGAYRGNVELEAFRARLTFHEGEGLPGAVWSQGRALLWQVAEIPFLPAELAAEMGIDATQTMAFGDYLNDYEMLQAADWSFAMSNAHPDILDVANYTAPPNHENGVITTVRSVLGL